jgi:hypothetical protein
MKANMSTKRPKPPSKYYKVKAGNRHPLAQCPFCGSKAPFVFSDSLAFQDRKAQSAYQRFQADDEEWCFLLRIALQCGLEFLQFEQDLGPRPAIEDCRYHVDGQHLSHHWSRYRQGQCHECGTKIWHDLVVPHHYYYRPPGPAELQLPLMPEEEKGNDERRLEGTTEMFADLFRANLTMRN